MTMAMMNMTWMTIVINDTLIEARPSAIAAILCTGSADFDMSRALTATHCNKKLSYCWETVRRESMLRIAEMDVEMTT